MKAKVFSVTALMLILASLSLSATTVSAKRPSIAIVAGHGWLVSTVYAFPEHWPDGWSVGEPIPLATEGHRCYLWVSAHKIGEMTKGKGRWIDVDYEDGILTILFTVQDIDLRDYPWFFIHGTAKVFINGEYKGEYRVFFEGQEEVDIRIYLYFESGTWSNPWENCWYYAGGRGLESGRIVTISRP